MGIEYEPMNFVFTAWCSIQHTLGVEATCQLDSNLKQDLMESIIFKGLEINIKIYF